MKNKKLFIYVCCLVILSLIVTGCTKEVEVKDGAAVAVSLKGVKITATDYYQNIKETNISKLVDMIDKELLEKDYKADEEENNSVKEQISSLKQNYPNEDLFTQVITQYFGATTEKELEEVLRLEFKRTKAVKDYVSKSIKDSEIEKYYNENTFGKVKASHIIIIPSVSEDAPKDEVEEAEKVALKKAKEVISKLKKGEKFAKLAKEYSDEDSTANNGGDLGYFELDEMLEEFSNAVKKLKVNEYTKEPVKTKYGYHIILKTDEKDKPTLKESKDDIKEKITSQKLSADNTLYYQTLIDIRKDKNIKWNDTVLEKKYNTLMDNLLKTAKEQTNSKQN